MMRWTISNVMTKSVVTVREDTPFKEIVDRLAEHRVSAVPVVDAAGRLVGIVSEGDLLYKLEFAGLEPHVRVLERKRTRVARAKAAAETAKELMTRSPVSIAEGASLTAAARIMEAEHVKRLPVVDSAGRLVGIVSRGDLLRVYLRDDRDILKEVEGYVLQRTLWLEPGTVSVSVVKGVVTLAGTVDRRSTVPIVVQLVGAVTGVVEVVNHLTYHHDDTAEIDYRHYVGPTSAEPAGRIR
jgi:CBS domain-containing protein